MGCSHGCKYCFVQRKADISKIEPMRAAEVIGKWVAGERNHETRWCDWNIPLHFGGMSDPLQPCELQYGETMRALEVLAEAQYPYVLSSKGALLADKRYLSVIGRGRAVVQISHVSPQMDRFEVGAPKYTERLAMMPKVASNCLRLNVRVQPYMPQALGDVLAAIPKYKAAGVHGITVEGLKLFKKTPGTVKHFGDLVYGLDLLKAHFTKIKMKCREHGLAFYSGENRLRSMSDSLNCCGTDGVEGFVPNRYNFNHLRFAPETAKPTAGQLKKYNQDQFRTVAQNTQAGNWLKGKTFAEVMDIGAKTTLSKMIG